jgi:hypothetical protein
LSREFGKWIIAMPGDKGSKIDAKIRQGAVPSKAIEIIVKLNTWPFEGGGGTWNGLKKVNENQSMLTFLHICSPRSCPRRTR